MKRLFLFCFAAAVCAAQGPKIFIVTDMEGVGGVNNADEQLLPGQPRVMHILLRASHARVDLSTNPE